MRDTDTAVVGGGMAGTAVASELDRLGEDYLLLEAGPDRGRVHVGARVRTTALAEPEHDPCFEPFLTGGGRLWGGGEIYGRVSGYRARLGGRSLYWRGIAMRIEDDVLDGWPGEVREVLLGADGAGSGLYAHVEDQLAAWSGTASLREFRTVTERRLTDQLRSVGYDAGPTPRAVRVLRRGRWAAYSPLPFLAPRRALTQFRVQVIVRDPGGTFHLTDRDSGRTVSAARIVLCAGVFRNIVLIDALLRSAGVNPPERYRIVDHLGSGVLVAKPGSAHEPMDSSVLVGFDQPSRSNLVLENRRDVRGVLLDAWAMGEQPTAAASEYRVQDDNLRVGRRAALLLACRYQAQRAALEQLAAFLCIPISWQGSVFDYRKALALAKVHPGIGVPYRVPLGELDHESGGLELGGEIVGLTGEARALESVFVAGPCLFPRAGAANPTLTTLALSQWVAGQVAGR